MISLLEQANRFLRPVLQMYVKHAYARKLQALVRAAPELHRPRHPVVEREHVELWAPLNQPVPLGWYRFYSNMSGVDDPRYVPDNVYHAVIEKTLNDINYAWVFADKNFYERHFPGALFPSPIIRNIAGTFVDAEYRVISEAQARDIFNGLDRDVVAKPSVDSNSGDRVRLIRVANNRRFCEGKELSWNEFRGMYVRNFIVQATVSQHRDLALLNPSSLNTLRVFTYRSVFSNQVHVMTTSLRMGCKGSFVDNGHAGGIMCGVNLKTGRTSTGIVHFRTLHTTHPDTGLPLAGRVIPALDDVCEVCRKVAHDIYSHRCISFDVAVGADGRPVIIEINTFGQGIGLAQLFNPPLFGNMTSEVIDYCARNVSADHFKVLRLFG